MRKFFSDMFIRIEEDITSREKPKKQQSLKEVYNRCHQPHPTAVFVCHIIVPAAFVHIRFPLFNICRQYDAKGEEAVCDAQRTVPLAAYTTRFPSCCAAKIEFATTPD